MNGGNLRKIYFLVASLFLFMGTAVSLMVFFNNLVDIDYDPFNISFSISSHDLEAFLFIALPFVLLFVVHFVIFWKMTRDEK